MTNQIERKMWYIQGQPQNLQEAGLRSQMTLIIMPDHARFQVSSAEDIQQVARLLRPHVRPFFIYLKENYLRFVNGSIDRLSGQIDQMLISERKSIDEQRTEYWSIEKDDMKFAGNIRSLTGLNC